MMTNEANKLLAEYRSKEKEKVSVNCIYCGKELYIYKPEVLTKYTVAHGHCYRNQNEANLY